MFIRCTVPWPQQKLFIEITSVLWQFMHNFLQPNIYYLQFPKLYIFKIPNFFLKHLVHTCVHMFFKHHCTHMCTHCLKHLVHTGMTCICSLFPRKYDLYLFFMFTQVLLVLLFVSSIWAPHSWKSWRELCPLRKASPNSRSVVSCELWETPVVSMYSVLYFI